MKRNRRVLQQNILLACLQSTTLSWCSEGMGKHNSFSTIQHDVTPSAVHFKVFIYIEILPELHLGTVAEVNKRESIVSYLIINRKEKLYLKINACSYACLKSELLIRCKIRVINFYLKYNV